MSVYEKGDPGTFVAAPNGNMSGFTPATDGTPTDPYTWGATNSTPVSPAQVVPVDRILEQTPALTRLRVRPVFGELPDNALIVLQLSFGIRDFGGTALSSTTFAFTTENRAAQDSSYTIPFDASTPIDKSVSTADLNTARSAGKAQAWLLFAGDGDNGGSTLPSNLDPAFPKTIDTDCSFRTNSGTKTAFDPPSDVNLNTGASRNRSCNNETDGSTAVIWEFSSFRIRGGVTVRIVGKNPAIILVQGDAVIESGGRLLVRGDDQNGAPDGKGENGQGYNYPTYPSGGAGGKGVAGGANGGKSTTMYQGTGKVGEDGYVGYGSDDYDSPAENGGLGAGGGQIGATSSTSTAGCSGGGGGGGHASEGIDGGASQSAVSPFDSAAEGQGGGTYPTGADADKMYTPSAGSGGGGGGENFYSYTGYYEGPGGAGGAGGGFVDLTSGGDIKIYGTIDAAGSNGGHGGTGGYGNYLAGGGGGGGSGGGIRLLTPNAIDVTGGTITAAGGQGGTGGVPTYKAADFVRNDGGAGGLGRIVLETGDSLVTGFSTATMIPSEGQDGFYRGPFDPTRFQGGGLEPVLLTGLMLLGPVTPPSFIPNAAGDFVQDIPAPSSLGPGQTSMLLELQGYPMLPDGTPDMASPTGWYTVGYFASTVTGSTWFPEANPGDVVVPPDNLGAGIANLDGSQYVQARIHFWLPAGISPTQPGPWLDSWTIRFQYDN